VYLAGDTVIYDGQTYTAKWWVQGQRPGESAAWERNAPAGSQEWMASKAYNAGDQVTYQGNTYKAKWWTKGTAPGTAGSPWQVQ
ncbi:chitinase, partial [Photobacterium aphoticum]